MTRLGGGTALTAAVLATALGMSAAAAAGHSTPGPSAAVIPPVAGFHATGTLVVAATISGSPLNVGGQVALYESGSLYRLDLLTLAFPHTDPTASAVAGALLAPGGATIIYDGDSGRVVAYSTGNRAIYESDPTPTASPAAPASAVGAKNPLAMLAGVARQLHDVQTAAIQLTGHSSLNGHTTDDLDVQVRRQRPGRPREDYHAQLWLADDLGGFPVRIAASSTPPTPQDFGGSAQLDLTTVSRDVPDPTAFAIPDGLRRVNSIGEVLQAAH